MTSIDLLVNRVADRSKELGWAILDHPVQAADSEAFRYGGTLDSEVDYQIPKALMINRHAVLFGALGHKLEDTSGYWSFLQRRAAHIRASLPPGRNEDVSLFLVGAAGSDVSADWRALAMEIERNDLVCRKLVWLPPLDSNMIDNSLESFIGRTFLSKPWKVAATTKQPQLDASATTPKELIEWQDIINEQLAEVDYDKLVTRLIEIFRYDSSLSQQNSDF